MENSRRKARKPRPLSQKVLRRMIKDGLIAENMTDMDRHVIDVISHLSGNDWYVAQMNLNFRPYQRALMLAFPNFGKVERYILSSFLPKNEYAKPPKVSVQSVAENLKDYYHIRYSLSEIRRIRQIAYNMLRDTRGKTKRQYLALTALERKSYLSRAKKSVKKSR